MSLRTQKWLFGFLLAAGVGAPALAGDTTYSETRPVSRERERSAPAHPAGGTRDPMEEEDQGYLDLHSGSPEEETRATFFRECMEPGETRSFSEAAANILSLPLRLGICYVVDNFRASHVDLFTGSPRMGTLPDRPWRFGWGFGFGALYLPGAAGGMPFNLHAEALRSYSPNRQVRLRIGTFGAIAGSSVDYERTAFVDGKPIGVQRDSLAGYSQSGYPALLEGLLTNENGLYLSAGAGAVFLREGLHYFRTTDYGVPAEWREEKRERLRPMLSLSVGRFASRGGGRKFHRFEIRYQATLLLPERRGSFPADNATASHSLTWDWGWLW